MSQDTDVIGSSPEAPGLPRTPEDSVCLDLDCRGCGYNLRTLSWGALCPECNLQVEASRLPSWFQASSHREIRRIRQGLTILVAVVAISTLVYDQHVILYRYFFQLRAHGFYGVVRLGEQLFRYADYLLAALQGLGIWIIIQPAAKGRSGPGRRIGNACIVLYLIALAGLAANLQGIGAVSNSGPASLAVLICSLALLCYPISLMLLVIYLSRLIRNDGPARFRQLRSAALLLGALVQSSTVLNLLAITLRLLQDLLPGLRDVSITDSATARPQSMAEWIVSQCEWCQKYVDAPAMILLLLLVVALLRNLPSNGPRSAGPSRSA